MPDWHATFFVSWAIALQRQLHLCDLRGRRDLEPHPRGRDSPDRLSAQGRRLASVDALELSDMRYPTPQLIETSLDVPWTIQAI